MNLQESWRAVKCASLVLLVCCGCTDDVPDEADSGVVVILEDQGGEDGAMNPQDMEPGAADQGVDPGDMPVVPRDQDEADMPDAATVDMPDAPVDEEMSAVDVCAGVSCGPNGRCVAVSGAPSCACDAGFAPSGLSCVSTPAPNQAPTVTDVFISPSMFTRLGDTLTCVYTFSDPDGDRDRSSIEWLVDGVVAGSGETFTDYMAEDVITCRVTPSDGRLEGVPMTSAPVVAPMAAAPVQLSVGGGHTCAVRGGAAFCWGFNNRGQLGDGTTMNRSVPTPVVGLGSNVTAIHAAENHTCAIQQGALKCWGNNEDGQLGDGTTMQRNAPVNIPMFTSSVVAVSGGAGFTCAIRGRALSCWGLNDKRQLGDGTTQKRGTPALVMGMGVNVTGLSAGIRHGCAIQQGALLCWGDNEWGQLGDGSRAQRTSPVQVQGMSADVTAVSGGNQHTCAIQGGGLQCWGNNLFGQLGSSGTALQRSTPGQVMGLSANVSVVNSGDTHTCAIQSGGLKCWGLNNTGQLGDGTMMERRAPVNVSGLGSNMSAVSTGRFHTCAAQQGSSFCWGSNNGGALGTGLGMDSLTPVAVLPF